MQKSRTFRYGYDVGDFLSSAFSGWLFWVDLFLLTLLIGETDRLPGVLSRVSDYWMRSPGEIALEPGDAIYLYADGITEQPDANGVLFGEERLRAGLEGGAVLEHPETCAGTVLALVEAHAAGAEQSDDRTQLLLRWRGA